MSRVYKIGEHTFTQREDGLYICDEPFTMSREECEEWMHSQEISKTLFARIDGADYVPVAVTINSELTDEKYRSYVTEFGESDCARFTSCDLPVNYLGGLFYDN